MSAGLTDGSLGDLGGPALVENRRTNAGHPESPADAEEGTA
ncbi:hypothetical protein [Nocardia sp. NPDC047654]